MSRSGICRPSHWTIPAQKKNYSIVKQQINTKGPRDSISPGPFGFTKSELPYSVKGDSPDTHTSIHSRFPRILTTAICIGCLT